MQTETAVDRRGIALLSIGHMLNDVNQGAIPALLPFLVTERNLSYTAVSGIVLTATVVSAIIQPLLGLFSDRHPIPWLMPLGMFLGGLGIAFSGTVPEYWMIIVCMLVSGAGVATFHPEGYRFANYVSREQRATGMSIFSVGGNLGFALGPLFMTGAILAFGLNGSLALFAPAAIFTLVLLLELPRLSLFRASHHARAAIIGNAKTNWPAFLRLTIVVILRAMLYYGLITFLPLYLVKIRGLPIPEANSALIILSISGAVGTLITGNIADRYGRKRLLVMTLATVSPLLFLLLNIDKALILMFLPIVGVAMISSSTVAIVMGQEYAAANLGVATGITTGLAIGLGGLASPVFGYVADQYGLTATIFALATLPLFATAMAATLPPGQK